MKKKATAAWGAAEIKQRVIRKIKRMLAKSGDGRINGLELLEWCKRLPERYRLKPRGLPKA